MRLPALGEAVAPGAVGVMDSVGRAVDTRVAGGEAERQVEGVAEARGERECEGEAVLWLPGLAVAPEWLRVPAARREGLALALGVPPPAPNTGAVPLLPPLSSSRAREAVAGGEGEGEREPAALPVAPAPSPPSRLAVGAGEAVVALGVGGVLALTRGEREGVGEAQLEGVALGLPLREAPAEAEALEGEGAAERVMRGEAEWLLGGLELGLALGERREEGEVVPLAVVVGVPAALPLPPPPRGCLGVRLALGEPPGLALGRGLRV